MENYFATTKYVLHHNGSKETQDFENFLKENELKYSTTYINNKEESSVFIGGIETPYNQKEFTSLKKLIIEQINKLEETLTPNANS